MAKLIKKIVIKKEIKNKCVIGHEMGETEADGAEIGTERVEMQRRRQKNIPKHGKRYRKYREISKNRPKNVKKNLIKWTAAPGL